MKIGANGSLDIGVTTSGDVSIAFKEDDVMTSEKVELDVHPTALGGALKEALGAANKPWVGSAIDFLMAELLALAPKSV